MGETFERDPGTIEIRLVPASDGQREESADGPTEPTVVSPSSVPAKRRGNPAGPGPAIYAVIVIVMISAVVGSVYFATDGFHRNSGGSSGTILIANQTSWSIPISQFNGVAFIASANGTVNGTLYESGGLQIYTMTPTQYAKYIKTDVVPGYEWTSGRIANDSVYTLGVAVPAGQWDLAFSDPFSNITYANTLVAFYTNLVLIAS